jgi:hypothetical protein
MVTQSQRQRPNKAPETTRCYLVNMHLAQRLSHAAYLFHYEAHVAAWPIDPGAAVSTWWARRLLAQFSRRLQQV